MEANGERERERERDIERERRDKYANPLSLCRKGRW